MSLPKMVLSQGRARFLLFFTAASLLIAGCAPAPVATSPSVLNPASPPAAQIANLGWIFFALAGLVLLFVTALLLIGVFRARRDFAEPELQPASGDNRILVWLGVATGVILIAVTIYVIFTDRAVSAAPAKANTTVEVIGHQWWWEVKYPERNVTTANEIHIPSGEPVLFKVTSDDVIHSFWVPQLQGKIDLIPGRTNTLWLQADQPGTYRGQCAEYCGIQHAKMALFVIAQPRSEFDAWLTAQSQVPAPPTGGRLYNGMEAFLGSACVYCHTIKGTNASGTLGPDLTHLASRNTIGAGTLPNTRGNLAGWIVDAQSIKPGNHMPAMHLDADQLQTILDYLESLK